MKTLIIAGTYKQVPYTKVENGLTSHGTNVQYTVELFGQTADKPLMQYITSVSHLGQFESLQRVCRERYCKYFDTDLFNIVSMESLVNIDVLPVKENHVLIPLTTAEITGIKSYLTEVDEPTTNEAIENEVKVRLWHALRDTREAISDHVLSAENDMVKASTSNNRYL